jgi:hypothetical protein
MNQSPPPQSILNFFRKLPEIFPSQDAPPVSTSPAANFATNFPDVVDTGGKFAAGVVDTGDNLRPVVHLDLRISPRIFEKI